MKGTLTLIAALLYAVSINYAYSQSHFFDVQTLNSEQSLPHNNTFQVKQDHKGYIWISTQGHISRYDGVTFKTRQKVKIFLSHYLCLEKSTHYTG